MSAGCHQESGAEFREFPDKAIWADEWIKLFETGFRGSMGKPGFDMQYQFALLRFLRWHRLEGLFAIGCRRRFGDVADRVITDVTNRYLQRERGQALIWAWIESWASQHSILVKPVKGVSLSQDCRVASYPRFYEDIDVLVERRYVGKCVEFLLSQGFVASGGLSAAQALVCLDSLCCLNFHSPKAICSIDLHLNGITRGLPGSVTLAELVSRTHGVARGSQPVDWQLVYQQGMLIVSNFKNDWQRLDKLVDIGLVDATLTDGERMAVWELMGEWGYSRIYGITFQLLRRIQELADSPVALPLEGDLGRRRYDDKSLVDQIVAGWFKEPLITTTSHRGKAPRCALLDRHRAKAFYVFARLTHPTQNDIRFMPFLGTHMLPYTLVRLFRGLKIMARRFQSRMSAALRVCWCSRRSWK